MKLQTAIRIITIKENRVLLINNLRDSFYYFIGGKIESGETIKECIQRELNEETGLSIKVDFKKIIYISEYINKEKDKHKLEIFVLVDIDKFEELEGLNDPEHDGTDKLTWVDIDKLPKTLYPKEIAERLPIDYKNQFVDINIPHYY